MPNTTGINYNEPYNEMLAYLLAPNEQCSLKKYR